MLECQLVKSVLIHSIYIRTKITGFIKELNRLEYNSYRDDDDRQTVTYLSWSNIQSEPHLLCQFGTLKQVKRIVEEILEIKYSKYKWSDHKPSIPFIPGLNLMLRHAICGNKMDIIKYIYTRYEPFKDEIMLDLGRFALTKGKLEIAKYIIDSCDVKFPLGKEEIYKCDLLTYRGNKSDAITDELVTYYVETHIRLKKSSRGPSETSAIYGRLDLLKLIHNNGYFISSEILYYATVYGHLSIIKYLYEEKIWRSISSIRYHLNGDYVDIVEYYYTIESELDMDFVMRVAKKGYINTIKYIYTRFPNITTMSNYNDIITCATSNGHLPIIKYILNYNNINNIKTSKINIYEAVINGKLETVQFILECGLGEYQLDILDHCKDTRIWMYLYNHSSQTLPFTYRSLEEPIANENMEMIDFIIHQCYSKNRDTIWRCLKYAAQNQTPTIFHHLFNRLIESKQGEWDFSKVLLNATKYNQPVEVIQLIVNFNIQQQYYFEAIINTIKSNNLESFMYLLPKYEGEQYYKMIRSGSVLNGEDQLKFTRHIIDLYHHRLDFIRLLKESLSNESIELFKYIESVAIKLGKLDRLKVVSFNCDTDDLLLGDNKLQYIREMYPHFGVDGIEMKKCLESIPTYKYIVKNERDIKIRMNILNGLDPDQEGKIFKYLIPLYKYYDRKGKGIVYNGSNMDVIRFIYYNFDQESEDRVRLANYYYNELYFHKLNQNEEQDVQDDDQLNPFAEFDSY